MSTSAHFCLCVRVCVDTATPHASMLVMQNCSLPCVGVNLSWSRGEAVRFNVNVQRLLSRFFARTVVHVRNCVVFHRHRDEAEWAGPDCVNAKRVAHVCVFTVTDENERDAGTLTSLSRRQRWACRDEAPDPDSNDANLSVLALARVLFASSQASSGLGKARYPTMHFTSAGYSSSNGESTEGNFEIQVLDAQMHMRRFQIKPV